ncbi:MAG: hypothetical protein ACLTSZ_03615 [Lachnospiraceae bacterium]
MISQRPGLADTGILSIRRQMLPSRPSGEVLDMTDLSVIINAQAVIKETREGCR